MGGKPRLITEQQLRLAELEATPAASEGLLAVLKFPAVKTMLVDRLHPLTSEEGERGQSPALE